MKLNYLKMRNIIKAIVIFGLIISSIASLLSILTRKTITIISPDSAILLLYTSSLALILYYIFYLKIDIDKYCPFGLNFKQNIFVQYIILIFVSVIFLVLLIFINFIELKFILALLIFFGLLISISIYFYNSKFTLYEIILLFNFIPCYVYYYYPYYVGNDTFRDLCYAFNILLTGHYQGTIVYPINVSVLLYSIILQFVGFQNITIVILILDLTYIVLLTIILRCLQKSKHIGNSFMILIMLSQFQFVSFLALGFINQFLALLYGLFIFYLILSNNDKRFISKNDMILSLLFSLLLSITHGFSAVYILGLLTLFIVLSLMNNLTNVNIMLIKKIFLIMLITLILYNTYSQLVYFVSGIPQSLLAFLKNFIYSIFGKDNLDIKVVVGRTSGINMLWMYLPFANLLALTIVEYLVRNEDELGHSNIFDFVFFVYPMAWIILGIITTVDPVESMLRYFSVPSIIFLSMYPRRIVTEKNTIIKLIVFFTVSASVISSFTNGSIISNLDFVGSGQGYLTFPAATNETNFLSRLLLKNIQESITIITDVNLAKGISIATMDSKIDVQYIVTKYNRLYISANVNRSIIEFNFILLGGYGFILDDKTYNMIKLNKLLLLLRPTAFEYMHLYRLHMSYDDFFSQSDLVVLCTGNTYLVLFH